MDEPRPDPAEEARQRQALAGALRALPRQLVRAPARMVGVVGMLEADPSPPLGMLLDLVTDLLHLGLQDRMRLLEAAPVAERSVVLAELLAARVSAQNECFY